MVICKFHVNNGLPVDFEGRWDYGRGRVAGVWDFRATSSLTACWLCNSGQCSSCLVKLPLTHLWKEGTCTYLTSLRDCSEVCSVHIYPAYVYRCWLSPGDRDFAPSLLVSGSRSVKCSVVGRAPCWISEGCDSLCSTRRQVEEMLLIVMLCVFFPSGLLLFLFFFTFFSVEKNPQHKIYRFWMFSTVKYIYVVVKRISWTFSSTNLRLFPLQYQLSIPSSPQPLLSVFLNLTT